MIFLDFLISFFCCSFFPMVLYFYFNDVNIAAIILLLLPSIVSFIVDKIVLYKKEKEGSSLIRTPENERIVLNYLRNNNIRLVDYTNHEAAVKEMSFFMFEYFLDEANSSNNNTNDSESISDIKTVVDYVRRENAPQFNAFSDNQLIDLLSRLESTQLARIIRDAGVESGPKLEQTLKQNNVNNYIPKGYTPINIKGFKNIEIYDNEKDYLIKPLKQPSKNSLYSNKSTTISKDTIISELHLHYLLIVIDTAIGE